MLGCDVTYTFTISYVAAAAYKEAFALSGVAAVYVQLLFLLYNDKYLCSHHYVFASTSAFDVG